MFRKKKPRVEITLDEHKALKALEESLKRQIKDGKGSDVTADEIVIDYTKLYPPNLCQRAFKVHNISRETLESLRSELTLKGLVEKDLKNYTDQSLEEETRFVKLTEEVRVRLLQRK